MIKYIYSFLALFFVGVCALPAQTSKEELAATPEKTAGVYYAYPDFYKEKKNAAPKGYKPFYVSHYGRHGSRYLISDNDYKWVMDILKDAKENNALTPLGLDVLDRLQSVWIEVEGKGGDLSPLGVREHKGIAERMYKSYPEVFVASTAVSARSTIVPRCILSMASFCESLKEQNPKLLIEKESSNKYMSYLNPHSKEAIEFRSSGKKWGERHRKFEAENMHSDRFISSIFSDKIYTHNYVNPNSFMWGLYWIASGMQNIETDVSFYDLFESEELFNLWQTKNYGQYMKDANWEGNERVMFENSKPLLKNILESANEVISGKGNGATLRFGHDGNIIPLALLLHLDGCYESVYDADTVYKAWSNFKVTPMAANIQLIFFRKSGSEDILVKFLHNERETLVPPIKTDIAPFYHWKDVEAFYVSLLNK